VAKSVYFAAATLDGFVADPDDGIDWLTKFDSGYDGPGEPVLGAIDAWIEEVGALVMGSSTYEFILGHNWAYGDRPSWVLTSRKLAVAEGADVRFHDGPVADIYDEATAAAGDKHLWVMGGGPVASQFAAAGLLDELHVTIVPVILGAGKPLFSEPISQGMTLLGSRRFDNGMYELRYALAR
jgi:dihydrofolate reductase